MKKLTIETALFSLALVLGAVLRLVSLGHASLTDSEAALALQAYGLARGADVSLAGHPAYLLLTRLLFGFFSATDFLARFWPALAGCALIGAAWLARDLLGRIPAVILAFFLAFDPGLVAVSREAGSQVIALTCLVYLMLFAWRRSAVGVGVFAGLSLLGGPQLWPGLIGTGVFFWMAGDWRVEAAEPRKPFDWRTAAGFGLGTFVLVGSIFMIEPRGLSAAAGSLVDYLSGWGQPSGISIPRMLAVLLAYELFALAFGLLGVLSGIRQGNRLDRALGIWWAAALLLALIYPARVPFDLAWAWLPMLALAARQMPRLWAVEPENRLPAAGQAALTLVLGFFLFYSLLRVPGQVVSGTNAISEPAIRTVIGVVLLFLVTALVAWGWTTRVALIGLGWGAGVALALVWLAAAFHGMGISRNPQAELIRSSPYVADADLVRLIIGEVEEWRPDPTTPIEVAAIGLEMPSLRWGLRNYPQAVFTNAIDAGRQPEVVLTARQESLALAAAYRGQELTWNQATAWDLVAPSEWLRWLLFRDLPSESIEAQRIVLWVRADAFPGGAGEQAPAGAAPEPQAPAPGSD